MYACATKSRWKGGCSAFFKLLNLAIKGFSTWDPKEVGWLVGFGEQWQNKQWQWFAGGFDGNDGWDMEFERGAGVDTGVGGWRMEDGKPVGIMFW